MKLIWGKIKGFKRFEKASTINLENKVIAIVGPNEVGKTSLIEALAHIDNGKEFVSAGPVQELTRDIILDNNDEVVQAAYCLDSDDQAAVAHIPTKKPIRWLYIKKRVNGRKYFQFEPQPELDASLREEALRMLEKFVPLRWFQRLISKAPDLKNLAEQSLDALKRSNGFLTQNELAKVSSFKDLLSKTATGGEPKYVEDFLQLLARQIEIESSGDLDEEAYEILKERRPRFLYFSEEDRNLRPSYGIDPDPNKGPFPKALVNLGQLSGLDLERLRGAITDNNQGRIETLIQNANQTLRQIFDNSWSQSGVAVFLSVNGRTLHISINHVEDEDIEITSIAERSDGLRHFVALIAFVSRQTNVKPVLLMDEVENHLHYDAQADLVQMFARQEVASKIIYTTHSVGCLPEDLGSGVRLVEATQSNNRSAITNWFWSEDRPGFYPLLFGMGASMMAFIPLRFSLVCEGPTDMLLLPSLLREAINEESLGFQIVPGLSIANNAELAILDQESPRTAYLVDSDSGGNALRQKLEKSGIQPNRIFCISADPDIAITTEDFIDPILFCKAINSEISRWQHTEQILEPNNLPAKDRIGYLKQWLKENNLKKITKRSLARNILESRNGQPILFMDRKEMLYKLAYDIQQTLRIPE